MDNLTFTKYARDRDGEWYAVTLQAKDSDTAAERFNNIFPGDYQYWAPQEEGFPRCGVVS